MALELTTSIRPGDAENPDHYIMSDIEQVSVCAYVHDGVIIVDVEGPAGQDLVITLNDGDLFRGEVPE